MGRTIIGMLVALSAVLAVGVTPAHARDRKSEVARDREALVDMLAARPAVQSSGSSSAAEVSVSRNGKPIAPLAEHQPAASNPFRFNMGGVAVEPAVGGIKGARFSIGF